MIAIFCIEFFNENYLNFHNLVIILWNRLIFFVNSRDTSATVLVMKILIFKFEKKNIIKNFWKIHNLLHITIKQIALRVEK